MKDSSFQDVGTPNGIDGCLTIGSNGMAGDTNQSDNVSIVDALLTAQYCTFRSQTYCLDTSVADVNRDDIINIVDALIIAQYSVGIVKELPL